MNFFNVIAGLIPDSRLATARWWALSEPMDQVEEWAGLYSNFKHIRLIINALVPLRLAFVLPELIVYLYGELPFNHTGQTSSDKTSII